VPGARPFPILVAALAPRMLQLAGELADGTVTWMVGRKTFAGHIVPRIRAAAAAAGRPAPRLALGVPDAVCDDERAGREQADRTFAHYGRLPNYRRMLDLEGAAGRRGHLRARGPRRAPATRLRGAGRERPPRRDLSGQRGRGGVGRPHPRLPDEPRRPALAPVAGWLWEPPRLRLSGLSLARDLGTPVGVVSQIPGGGCPDLEVGRISSSHGRRRGRGIGAGRPDGR
jgi:hypothetical protein